MLGFLGAVAPPGTHTTFFSSSMIAPVCVSFRLAYSNLTLSSISTISFDEPLLHSMYVDKKLKSVAAVQTLSRLNRTCFGKASTFVLDFENTEEDIKKAFQPFYEEASIEGATDLNVVYDFRNKLNEYMLFNYDDVEKFNDFMSEQAGKGQNAAALGKLAGMFRPVIDRYRDLSEDDQYAVRDYLRKFTRTYAYITQIVRLHDKDLFAEYLYTSNLLRLLPKSENPSCVYQLINTGLLPVLKLGSYKVRHEALMKFLSEYEGYDLSDPKNVEKLTATA